MLQNPRVNFRPEIVQPCLSLFLVHNPSGTAIEMTLKTSPFLHPGTVSAVDKLSIIHLRRDLQVPTVLRERDEDDEGYLEGKVVNTRFGSFPHSTLIGLPWGSQVRASKVDTGSRGRRVKGKEKKRRRDEAEEAEAPNKRPKLTEEQGDGEASTPTTVKEETDTVAASTGFIHLLPPTPENWTISLPHRTQVVYTPDYSYILHRLRARPGTTIIEAGAGSGSFTHASVRAVYSGYPQAGDISGSPTKKRKLGKVWSFEFHEQRYEKLEEEVQDHGLEELVQITHRDVCKDGFLVGGQSPNANAVFLDLPAPWLALPHLARSRPPPSQELGEIAAEDSKDTSSGSTQLDEPFISPLNPSAPVHICTFSPCIEQVQRTISVMRQLGWVDISMVEISQKRIEVVRQRVGIDQGAQHGVQSTPASVDEAVRRLIEVEGTFKSFHESGKKSEVKKSDKVNPSNRDKIMEGLVERKVYKDGRLVHKTEQEVKGHTSYLVFAVLPQDWSEEDEERARVEWPIKIRREEDDKGGKDQVIGMSKRQVKRAERQAKKERPAAETRTAGEGENRLGVEKAVRPAEDQRAED
jgi:tRNA (adenine57-N1/adenine58-N1)-methyltransferase catalytic subunit